MHLVWKITFTAAFLVGVSGIVKAKGEATVLLARRDCVHRRVVLIHLCCLNCFNTKWENGQDTTLVLI